MPVRRMVATCETPSGGDLLPVLECSTRLVVAAAATWGEGSGPRLLFTHLAPRAQRPTSFAHVREVLLPELAWCTLGDASAKATLLEKA